MAVQFLAHFIILNRIVSYLIVSFVDRSAPVSTPALLDWQTVHKNLPWSVVLLLGGGFALAFACKVDRLLIDYVTSETTLPAPFVFS